MKPMGTKFQLEVWNQIKKTTKDKALYYKYITKKIDKPDACRAVTNAFSKNPLPIKFPWHKVILESRETGIYFNKKNSVIIRIIVKKNL
tara:strand:- start:3587 stop:3853 length:267 start_codon:yes stop_codon:yes gene_type:complete